MSKTKISIRNSIPLLALALVLAISMIGATIQPAQAAEVNTLAASSSGRLDIVSVTAGSNVTIKVSGMPANTAVTARMGPQKTKGAGGTIVGTGMTASNGTLKATYAIPSELKGEKKIAVRVEVTANSKQFVYNWFTNTTSSNSGSSGSTIPEGSMSYGNITIVDVVEDKSVTISVAGAPANGRVAVWFDWKNKSGAMQGKQAGTLTATSSGTIKATVKMPSAATDRPSLRIRLQGIGNSYLAYKWFTNADDSNSGGGAPDDSTDGLPYIIVQDVIKDKSVTIKVFNLPKGEYAVRMDEIGTNGKNGTKVDTITIKSGTTYNGTFEIPGDLVGENEIVIRVQNVADSRYYAYTWFDNETTQ